MERYFVFALFYFVWCVCVWGGGGEKMYIHFFFSLACLNFFSPAWKFPKFDSTLESC